MPRVIRLTGASGEDDGLEDAIRAADVVIDEHGWVIKDRNGRADRPATDAEQRAARAA